MQAVSADRERLIALQDFQTSLSAILSPYDESAIDRWCAATRALITMRRRVQAQEADRR